MPIEGVKEPIHVLVIYAILSISFPNLKTNRKKLAKLCYAKYINNIKLSMT